MHAFLKVSVFRCNQIKTKEKIFAHTSVLFSQGALYFRNRFQKGQPPFSSVFLGILVWTIGENMSKSMRFHTKTHQWSRGLNLYFIFSVSRTDEYEVFNLHCGVAVYVCSLECKYTLSVLSLSVIKKIHFYLSTLCIFKFEVLAKCFF